MEETKDIEKWDVREGDPIDFFDGDLSYEMTGYRPIDGTRGLDFDPSWFTEAARRKVETGRYCDEEIGSEGYREYWDEEYRRCLIGMESHGYRVTGYNYFWLNYYSLLVPGGSDGETGTGRDFRQPLFMVEQYKYFHYVDMCRKLGLDVVGLKGRGVGWSEIAASILCCNYITRRNFRGHVFAFTDDYVDDTLAKCWDELTYLDDGTGDGMRKLRQVKNSDRWKRASHLTSEGVEVGYKSEIRGRVADKPRKVRGKRIDILMYEEAGSWPDLKKAWIQGDALVTVAGRRFGVKMAWGTGGDSGPGLSGLSDIFLDPASYGCLPYRHRCTRDGRSVLTGFFVPSYSIVMDRMDSRGWTDPEEGMRYYNERRDKLRDKPRDLMTYTAEYCYTPEEALSLEGDNDFNKDLLSGQLAKIKLDHVDRTEHVVREGVLEWVGGDGLGVMERGVRFVGVKGGSVRILEEPMIENGAVPTGMYVAGIDGIDNGMDQTSETYTDPSKFCIVVKRRVYGGCEPCYVAIYKGRPARIEEAYNMALKLQRYYNCKGMLESSKMGYKMYLDKLGVTRNVLMLRPKSAQAATVDTRRFRRSVREYYGAPTSPNVIAHQLELIATFIEDYSSGIWFEDMLEELVTYSYSEKRKFDIVAAMGMCELGDEDMYGLRIETVNAIREEFRYGWWVDEKGIRHRGRIPNSGGGRVVLGGGLDRISIGRGFRYVDDPRLDRVNEEWGTCV